MMSNQIHVPILDKAPMLMCFCFMNQYTALGQAGVDGHLVQPRVEVEQSPDPDLVQSLNLPMAGKLVRVLRLKNQRAKRMDVQVNSDGFKIQTVLY